MILIPQGPALRFIEMFIDFHLFIKMPYGQLPENREASHYQKYYQLPFTHPTYDIPLKYHTFHIITIPPQNLVYCGLLGTTTN